MYIYNNNNNNNNNIYLRIEYSKTLIATCHKYGNTFCVFNIYMNSFEVHHRALPIHHGGWCP